MFPQHNMVKRPFAENSVSLAHGSFFRVILRTVCGERSQESRTLIGCRPDEVCTRFWLKHTIPFRDFPSLIQPHSDILIMLLSATRRAVSPCVLLAEWPDPGSDDQV